MTDNKRHQQGALIDKLSTTLQSMQPQMCQGLYKGF